MERSRIPNRLKRYRRLAGFSQKEVIRKIGLFSASSLSKWEKGWSLPPLPVLFKLSLLYKTHPIHLYQDVWQRLKLELDGTGSTTSNAIITNNHLEYL